MATLLEQAFGFQRHSGNKPADASRRPRGVRCQVQLVLTPLGVPLPVDAYHSSLLINSVEYSFSGAGVVKAEGPMSHSPFRSMGQESIFLDCGIHYLNIAAFEAVLSRFFQPRTYDVLRKNCNSFSDCAVFFLTGVRMDARFKQLEAFAHAADRVTFVGQLFGYRPNPLADRFDVSRTLGQLAAERYMALPVMEYHI